MYRTKHSLSDKHKHSPKHSLSHTRTNTLSQHSIIFFQNSKKRKDTTKNEDEKEEDSNLWKTKLNKIFLQYLPLSNSLSLSHSLKLPLPLSFSISLSLWVFNIFFHCNVYCVTMFVPRRQKRFENAVVEDYSKGCCSRIHFELQVLSFLSCLFGFYYFCLIARWNPEQEKEWLTKNDRRPHSAQNVWGWRESWRNLTWKHGKNDTLRNRDQNRGKT